MSESEWDYFVVDAFTSTAFAGNPAAVVPDARGLSDEMMALIAAEFNLSETTFVNSDRRLDSAEPSDVQFRWFTPKVEVDLCGHATIAGVHALIESGKLREPRDVTNSVSIRIATRSGVLTAYVEQIPGQSGRLIWLDLIPAELSRAALDMNELAAAVGLSVDAFDPSLPPERTPQGKLVAFVQDTFVLNDAKPDFARLARLLGATNLWGLSLATVHTLTPSIHVQSRFFAPQVGVNEDPVTGSVHGPLTAYLVKHKRVPVDADTGLAGLSCIQGIPGGRMGMVHALVQPRSDGRYDVRIGGQAVTVMRGTLTLPGRQAHV